MKPIIMIYEGNGVTENEPQWKSIENQTCLVYRPFEKHGNFYSAGT